MTQTIRIPLTPKLALEVKRARLQRDIRRVQKNIARLQDWHEALVHERIAVEHELEAATGGETR
jgi:hypothetical protein